MLSLMSNKTKIKCAGIILLAFASALLASIWPVQLGEIYTAISDGTVRTVEDGALAVVTFGLTYLFAECITIIRRVSLDCVIASHESEIRRSSIEKLLKMPLSYYSGCLSGEKTAQLNQGVAGLSQFIKIVFNDIIAALLTAVCTISQVFLQAPNIIVGIMLFYLVLLIVISVFQIRSQNGIRESIVGQKNALDGQICQSISNLEMIRSMNAEEYEKKRLVPSILNISRTEKRHHRYMGSFDCLKQFCKISFQLVLLAASIFLISNGQMSSGSVITVCLLFQQLVKPIEETYRFMDETASSAIKAKALLEISVSPADEIFSIPSSGEKATGEDIRIQDIIVTSPEKDTPLARYDDLTIPGKKIVALQGPNGCGKTSLIRTLNRYYPHIQGKITLFGKEQNLFSQKQLTDMLYYTPQSTFFVAGTVRENLLYGLEREVGEEELITALQNVHLTGEDHNDSVIHTDPKEALDFILSEGATELSGGMKQRLALARAFLRTPKLYVFDEITANLDKEATNYVLANIESFAKKIGAGILYISHDQEVVDRCDMVIELRNNIHKGAEEKKAA